nr:MAG: putative replication-associated protein [scracolig virus 2]
MPAIKARKYCATIFQEEPLPFDRSIMRYLIDGKETCPSTGRIHRQVYMELKKQFTFNQIKNILPAGAHIEPANGDFQSNRDYCSKEGDFQEHGTSSDTGVRTDLNMVKDRILAGEDFDALLIDADCAEIIARHMPYFRSVRDTYRAGVGLSARKDRLAAAVLRGWQQDALTNIIATDPDPRHVHWFYDIVGGVGKSFMVDYLVAFHSGICFTNGKMADIAHAYNYQPLVIFDLARTQEDKLDAVYMALESFKNGRIFSPKYESHVKVFDVPHVLVFANFAPDKTKLSADRWKVHHLVSV